MGQNHLRELGAKTVLIYHRPQVNFKISIKENTITLQPQIIFPLLPQRSPTTQAIWHSFLSLFYHTFILKLLEIH